MMQDEDGAIPQIVDFGEDIASAERPNPLPVGIYPATIRAAEVKPSLKGTKYLSMQLFVDAKDYPPDYVDGNPEGMTISYNRLSMEQTKGARYNIKRFHEKAGLPLPEGSLFDPATLLNHEVRIQVRHGTWEGLPRAEVAGIVSAA